MADKVMVMDKGEVIAFDEPGKIGEFLSGESEADRHPMFCGLPAVMRIFSSVLPDEKSPLTIREGRLKAAELLEGKSPEVTTPVEEQPAESPGKEYDPENDCRHAKGAAGHGENRQGYHVYASTESPGAFYRDYSGRGTAGSPAFYENVRQQQN